MTGSRLSGLGGIALADILANGVAVLIISVVVSIAVRVEQEQRYAEQSEDLTAVMTREFSTKLVLNRLAAGPPAVLHDYETSELDQILDPDLLPILEMHGDYVREYYSGTVWPRSVLLQKPNEMDAWLAGFDEEKRQRLRIDVYDVGQFYLTMSILREHGIQVLHWHFLPGFLGLAEARNCPPGVPASDCTDLVVGEGQTPLPISEREIAAERLLSEDPDWPPPGLEADLRTEDQSAGALPEGVVSGGGVSGTGRSGGFGGEGNALGANGLGSFPSASTSDGGGRWEGGQGQGRGEGEGGTRFRMALPGNVAPDTALPNVVETEEGIEVYLRTLMQYLLELQELYDGDISPARLVVGFGPRIQELLLSPPTLPGAEGEALRSLAGRLLLGRTVARMADRSVNVLVTALDFEQASGALLAVPTNELVVEVASEAVGEGRLVQRGEMPVSLSLNAFPGIWQGLQVRIEAGSALLIPLVQEAPEDLRWRAVAYVSPRLNDFIVGFVHARFHPTGILLAEPESNRIRLGGQSLAPKRGLAAFGSRGWLAVLYILLAFGVIAFLLLRHKGRQTAA